jgi:hypothetical protein
MRSVARLCRIFVGVPFLAAAGLCPAAPIEWTDWTAATTTSAAGTLALDSGDVAVTFTGALNPAAQTAGGSSFWATNPAIYTAPDAVDNAPPATDIIRITGGTAAGTQVLSFSEPVVDPVMAILSLGQPGLVVTYDFIDAPFDVLNSGTGFFGGSPAGSLFEDPGDVLRGIEGHGIIQFSGTFSSISWTVPTDEFWHGFQVGVPSGDVGPPPPGVPEPGGIPLIVAALAGVWIARRLYR